MFRRTNPWERGMNLSGSRQQGHSAAHNTLSRLSRLQRIHPDARWSEFHGLTAGAPLAPTAVARPMRSQGNPEGPYSYATARRREKRRPNPARNPA